MNRCYRIFIRFLILLNIVNSLSHYRPSSYHHHHYGSGYGTGSWYYPRGRVQCFSGDSFIKLANGEDKRIGDLKSGDKIITIDQSKIISTEMIMMLDRQSSKKALFYKIITDSGHEISLTEYHLIPIRNSKGKKNYFFAKQIQIGDHLFVLSNRKLIYSPVINITMVMKKGYYAPLTMTGTLLVNNILASCFANVNNHQLAQYYMTPFRYYYQFLRLISSYDPFTTNNKTEGLHWMINSMFYFVYYFKPNVLIL